LVLVTIAAPALGALFALGWSTVRVPDGFTLAIAAGMYLLSAIGIEVGFHRALAHRAFRCGGALRGVLGVLGSMAAQGPLLYWVAVHRQHHRHADAALDPHSPRPAGPAAFWHAHIGWMFASRPLRLAALTDLLRDPVSMAVHRTYLVWVVAGLGIPVVAGLARSGPLGALDGFIYGGLVRMFLQHHVTWSLNSFAHLWGARPNATRDASGNLWVLALPTLGAAWHNNHHAFPSSASNDFRWWQLDPGAWLIRAAARLGWVWDVRAPDGRLAGAIGDPPAGLKTTAREQAPIE
jgi:stearoyl-CoA desaturase (delta-9 desaturase)